MPTLGPKYIMYTYMDPLGYYLHPRKVGKGVARDQRRNVNNLQLTGSGCTLRLQDPHKP